MLTALIFTGLIAFFLTPIIIKWYKKHNWLDDPKHNQHVKTTHANAVPRGGGLVIFLSVFLACLIFLQFDKYLIAILSAAFILTVVGFLDDLYNLNPFLRFGVNILAALIVISAGIGIAYVTNPFGTGVIHLNQPQIAINLFGKTHTIWVLADIFALIFIIWNMNAINWAKGFDGQLPSFVGAALIFIGLLSEKFIDDPTSFHTGQLSFIVAGAFLGFLIWNWYPQKIMPGYGAGSLAGFFLSVLSILSGAKVATTLMVLALPTADGIFTITRRILAGKSPFWGDRGHLHHKLMDVFGWGRRRIAIFYLTFSILMGSLSLLLNTTGKIIAIISSITLVFALQILAKKNQIKNNVK